jgi:hypothetical protein
MPRPGTHPRVRMHGTTSVLFALFVLLLLVAPATNAQTTGRISGTVRDQTGGVIAGAALTLTNLATNSTSTTSTGSDGGYLFAVVEAGSYRLAVEHPGFKTSIQNHVQLEVNQNERLDVTLEVGRPTERIVVEADAPQVDTSGAVLGKVENTRRIQDLPLVDRDTLQLGLLQAGVFAPDPDDGSGNPFSVSGQRSESLTFLLDGADNTDFVGNNIVVSPNPDAVQEFKILTNNYDAEFGRSSGGIVEQVIKSGTNEIHGTLFEFLRNDIFNARDFFLPERANFKRNVFGATIAAPIRRDKTFIFADYQGARRREGQVVPTITVPSAAERGGDFSELCTPGGGKAGFDAAGNCVTGGTQLVNPVTGANYPFNQLPVNSIAANYLNRFVPLPNAPGNGFITSPTMAIDEDQGILRVDHHLSERDLLTGTYVIDDQRQRVPFPFAAGGNNVGRNQTLSLAWTHSFERGWVNQFRASANRTAYRFAIPDDTTSPSALGFTNVNPDDPGGVAPPIMAVDGYFTAGPSPQGPTKTHDMTYQYQDHITIPIGKNEWKLGADFRFVQNNFDYDFYNNGSFTYGMDAAGPINGTFTGNVLVDFIAGFPGNYFQFSTSIYGIRTRSQYYYAEDIFKLTSRFTLNLGLRYEYNSPQSDIHDEIIAFFGAGAQSTVFPDAPPGILYPGDPGTPNKALVYPDRNNFAPRVGFAWDIFGHAKLVMRGGAGIFYDIEDGALNIQFGGQPPFGGVSNINFTTADIGAATNIVADPFTPLGLINPFPFASQGRIGEFFTPKVPFSFVTDPHFRTPYSENFNYGFQYQVGRNTAIEAVYVGSLGRKLITVTDVNPPQPAVESAQLANGFLNEDCARAFAGCVNPTSDPNTTLLDIGSLLTSKSIGNSASHELQLTVDRRYSSGLSFRAAYTLSKTTDLTSGFHARSSGYTDPFDPGLDHALADFDATHRFVFSGSWELPVGERFKRRFVVRKAVEGWQANVITTFQTGQPFTIYSNNDNSLQGNFLDRPNLIGKITKIDPRRVSTFTAENANCAGESANSNGDIVGNFYFDPTAFDCTFNSDGHLAPGSVASFGDLGRNTLRGPGINNWDISFLKRTTIHESKLLEFRAEFFNAFNHAQFLNPDRNGFDATFGEVSQTRGPRLIQFAVKLHY